mgnify:CR=1 FL=1
MAKKITESQKNEIIDSFMKGETIDGLSEKYNFTKATISRHLKKSIGTEFYKSHILKNKKKKSNITFEENPKKINMPDSYSENKFPELNHIYESSFVELTPLNCDIDNKPQKDLSSISINEVDFPDTVYMVVDNKIELEIKPLRDYPEWNFLSENELSRKTIQIFFDMKVAKRQCNKEQKILKVPNTDVFKIVAPILVSRGISRIVSSDKLISL